MNTLTKIKSLAIAALSVAMLTACAGGGAAMEMKEKWVNCTEFMAYPASAVFLASVLRDGGQRGCVAQVRR